MTRRDRLGRRRPEGQERGLRPRYPALPTNFVSKALRLSMSHADWQRFDALVAFALRQVPTAAQAAGLAVSVLMDAHARTHAHAHGDETNDLDAHPRDPSENPDNVYPRADHSRRADVVTHWTDWEQQKTLRLLRKAM